jgi:hypothetical protein
MMMAALGAAATLFFGGLETGTVPRPGAVEENPLSGGMDGVALAIIVRDDDGEDGSPDCRDDGISIRRKTVSPRSRTARNVRGRVSVRLIDQRPVAAASVFSR